MIEDILFPLVMGMIKAWKVFTWVVFYIFAKQLKWITFYKLEKGGIAVNGKEDCDVVVHNEWFYHRLAQDKTLGLGESYMDEWWDCKRIDQFMCKIIRSGIFKDPLFMFPHDRLSYYLQFNVFNLQTAKRSWEVAEKHYNLGK